MELKLVQESTGESISLERSPLVVGRLTDADIHCEDHSLARRHALIVEYLSGWAVHDLCSIAGIRINGTRVPRGELHAGDKLQIGKIIYYVQPDDPSSIPELAKLSSTDKIVGDSENFFADVLGEENRGEPTHAVLDFYLDGKLVRAVQLPGDVVIGYAERANICLPRKGISSLHCLVAQDGGTWYMHDLKGGTGIALDGFLKSTIRMESGARVQVGDYEVLFRNATVSEVNSSERGAPGAFDADKTEITVDVGADLPVALDPAPPPPADAEPLTPRMRIVYANADQAIRDNDFALAIKLYGEVCQASPLVLKFREKLRRAERKAAGRRPRARRFRYRGRILYFQLRSRWALQRGGGIL